MLFLPLGHTRNSRTAEDMVQKRFKCVLVANLFVERQVKLRPYIARITNHVNLINEQLILAREDCIYRNQWLEILVRNDFGLDDLIQAIIRLCTIVRKTTFFCDLVIQKSFEEDKAWVIFGCDREIDTQCHHGSDFPTLECRQAAEIEVTSSVIGIDLKCIKEALGSFVVVLVIVMCDAEVIVKQVIEWKLLNCCLEHLYRLLIVSSVIQRHRERSEYV